MPTVISERACSRAAHRAMLTSCRFRAAATWIAGRTLSGEIMATGGFQQQSQEQLWFGIGVVGPSRVGKTSLIVSLIEDAPRILAGRTAVLRVHDQHTAGAVDRRLNELRGAVRAGSFRRQALRSTERMTYYKLALETGIAGIAVYLNVLDFPGGWLSPEQNAPRPEEKWQECREFISRSTVLLVPVDSTVVMSATEPEHERMVPELLKIAQVEQVAESWATVRGAEPENRALLLLVPMKCESYFNDNGGSRDESGHLFKKVEKIYGRALDVVRANAPHAQILYCPLDTLGCVELTGAESWVPDGEGFQLSAEFAVRPPGEISVKGAEDILIAVCQHLAAARHAGQQEKTRQWERLHAEIEEERRRPLTLRQRWRSVISGERSEIRGRAQFAAAQAGRAARQEEHFEQLLADLALRPMGPRIREL
ncbi:TRAFAC clade GTPase domain-containing protein [Streptomyces sp. NPDC054940]